MSHILGIWPEVQRICDEAGIDPNSIVRIAIYPDSVEFIVADTSVTHAQPVEVMITHPWVK